MDNPFQPYIFGGVGTYFLTEGSNNADNDNASGVGGDVGYGFDYRIIEYISLGLENNFHFLATVEDQGNGTFFDDNTFDSQFVTLLGNITFHFR